MKVCYSRILCQERIGEVRAMTIREEIEQLKKEKNAVILAHYYVRPEVQEIADYVGSAFTIFTALDEVTQTSECLFSSAVELM